MASRDRVVLFASPHIGRGVFDSHVFGFLRALGEHFDPQISLICFGVSNPGPEQEEVVNDRLYCLQRDLGIEKILVLRGRNLFSLTNQMNRVRRFLSMYPEDRTIFMCQNYYAGYIGARIKKAKPRIHLHTDLKGVVPEETLYYGEHSAVVNLAGFALLKSFERTIADTSDSISVVSRRFADHIKKTYRSEGPILVFPSVVDRTLFYEDETTRKRYRAELGVEKGERVLAYCGSFQRWQNPEAIFDFFQRSARAEPSIHHLVLTYDVARANELARGYGVGGRNFHCIKACAEDVNGFLNASDVCLILRNRDLVNQVASPTKLAEYIATGNRIVMTSGIGDFSDLLRAKNFACVVSGLDASSIGMGVKSLGRLTKPTKEEVDGILHGFSLKNCIGVYEELFS